MNLQFSKLRGSELWFIDAEGRQYCYSIATVQRSQLWKQVPETIKNTIERTNQPIVKVGNSPNSTDRAHECDQLVLDLQSKQLKTQQFVVIENQRPLVFPYPHLGFSIRKVTV
jgi:hypothetical protein